MITFNCPGGWEGDCRPGGRFVVPYPSGLVETHLGTISAPDWLRWMRLAPDGRVVGNAQNGGQVWEWADGRWHDRGPSFGNRPCIYDAAGGLEIVTRADTFTGALGWRYVADDGRLIAAWETYDPHTPLAVELGVTQLWEWIQHGPFVVGQGADGGIFALDLRNGLRYQLGAGQSRLMAFALEGEQCAVAWVQEVASYFDNEPVPVGACVRWLTVAELLNRPPVDPDLPPPIDPEEPMKPPVVTVQTWTLDELLDGREFAFSDTENPALGYQARVWVQHGSMYASFTNKAGHAQTGMARPVKPCEDSGGGGGGNGGHEPPPPQHSPIKTDHGTFWQVDRSGLVSHGAREDPFEIGLAENGRYTFKAPNGRYVCAENGGADNVLIANRDSAGGWEQFTRGPSGTADKPRGFTLQADNGRFVAAEADGRLTCDRLQAGGWETFEAPAIVGTTPRLVIRDRIYFGQEDGTRFHAIECSDFSLYKYFLDSQDIGPVLAQRAQVGFNMLRVWLLNTSVIPGGLEPGSYLNFYAHLPEFLRLCASYGLYVELTAFTQTQTLMPDDSDQIAHWTDICDAIRDQPNVLLELVNEADQHDNATSAAFGRPSGVLASTGSNGSDHWPPEPDWDYLLYHTNDAPEFQRKVGHNAWEISEHRGEKPCISNENTRFDDKDADLDHAYDAAAGAALLCAGACFHSVRGKISELWGGHELECAKAWVAGAKSVPLEYQPGQYARHDDLNGPDCIRAYSRTLPDGRSWLVKIRP
jgi:hypothetical protein